MLPENLALPAGDGQFGVQQVEQSCHVCGEPMIGLFR
jgi:hypothetical protein